MNLVGGWDVKASSPKSPGSHERADSEIERAFTGAAVLDAFREEPKQLWRDGDGSQCGLAINATPLALWSVIRQQGIQAVRFVKSCVDGLVHRLLIGAIKDNGKRCPHSIRTSFHPLRCGCLHEQNRCEQRDSDTHQDCALGI